MNDTDIEALADSTRVELRPRIAHALARFDRIARAVDPAARPPGSEWTAHETVAHVLTLAQRYLSYRRGAMRLAAQPHDLDALNRAELEAVMAPVSELADQLQALTPELDELLDECADEGRVLPFHCGALVDGITWQTNWLGELLLHGLDLAQASKTHWELPERDMLLIARGLMQIAPAFVRPGVAPDTDVTVALTIPGARPYLVRIHDRTAETRARRPDDRPDAVLRMPASTLALLLYQRIGPFRAALRGLRVVGGRRPWVALKLQSYFEAA